MGCLKLYTRIILGIPSGRNATREMHIIESEKLRASDLGASVSDPKHTRVTGLCLREDFPQTEKLSAALWRLRWSGVFVVCIRIAIIAVRQLYALCY